MGAFVMGDLALYTPCNNLWDTPWALYSMELPVRYTMGRAIVRQSIHGIHHGARHVIHSGTCHGIHHGTSHGVFPMEFSMGYTMETMGTMGTMGTMEYPMDTPGAYHGEKTWRPMGHSIEECVPWGIPRDASLHGPWHIPYDNFPMGNTTELGMGCPTARAIAYPIQ